ncbi:Gfo/Idh/MocA family oxidoreductase [Siminovitchia acidinfaciens]|uniref:Gfo/Idh/MocA family oxidoreductase n=1 Tax=Siminovitchia acidinfaciens TaxID=2321395 RepID=A0A429XV63_9BACI|nr:Gfo/Idh/MocA family oxidoreductase [Siminovitchia acidinfaciens]RST72077.1 Gfo/Idh/MocA family oxidoreductase [Siminovitchia acidinfaciens]
MDKIKIGITGVGSMGLNHCRILSMMKDVDFVGVYDTDHEKCRQMAEKFQVKAYLSYEDLLKELDAVIIAVPSSFHFPLIVDAVQENKHVFVEKPFVTAMEEAEYIEEMLAKKNLILQVGHIERFNQTVTQLSEVIQQKDIISIETRRFGTPGREIDIDVILDTMIHDIDIVLHLIKSPLIGVSANGVSLNKEGQLDAANALLTFANGSIANLAVNRKSQEKMRKIFITEKSRFIKANLITKELFLHHSINQNSKGKKVYISEGLIEKIAIPYGDPLFEEISHFITCLKSGRKPIVGVSEATKALEVAFKIKNSMRY